MSKIRENQKLTTEDTILSRKRWNVPDWQDEDAYEYIKDLKGDYLRWEFLRRDKGYRNFSEKTPKPKVHFFLGTFIEPNISGDQLPPNFSFVDTIRQGKGIAIAPPPISSIIFKKGDPDPLPAIDAYYGEQLNSLWEENFVVIAFNPFKPITKQINVAQKTLNLAKKKIKEEYPKELRTSGNKRTISLKNPIKLLRIIDAHNEGLSNKEIGCIFFKYSPNSDPDKIGQQHLQRALTYWKTL